VILITQTFSTKWTFIQWPLFQDNLGNIQGFTAARYYWKWHWWNSETHVNHYWQTERSASCRY